MESAEQNDHGERDADAVRDLAASQGNEGDVGAQQKDVESLFGGNSVSGGQPGSGVGLAIEG